MVTDVRELVVRSLVTRWWFDGCSLACRFFSGSSLVTCGSFLGRSQVVCQSFNFGLVAFIVVCLVSFIFVIVMAVDGPGVEVPKSGPRFSSKLLTYLTGPVLGDPPRSPLTAGRR